MAVQHVIAEDPDTTIYETPGVMGGYPCIGLTRISVRALVEVGRRYGVETIAEYYPHLTRAQIDAGLAGTRAGNPHKQQRGLRPA